MGGGIYDLMGGAFMVGQLWQSKLFNLETQAATELCGYVGKTWLRHI